MRRRIIDMEDRVGSRDSQAPIDIFPTPAFKVANTLSNLAGKRVIKSLSGMVAQARWLPIKLRLTGLKLYRAAAYAEHL